MNLKELNQLKKRIIRLHKQGKIKNWEFYASIKSILNQIRGLKKQKHIEFAKNNFAFFLWYIIGYDFLKEREHRKWINFILDDSSSFKLLEASRETGKSTMVTVGYVLWRIVNNPNLTCIIASATINLAKKFLYEIKTQIENNKRFIDFFGELKPQTKENTKWDTYEIRIKGKTRFRESTVKAISINKIPTGDHVDLIICDDIVNMDDNNSTAVREDKKQKFNELITNIMKKDGKCFVVGTDWHEDDLYQSEIKEKNKHIKDDKYKWKIHISPCEKNGILVFPKILPPEKIERASNQLTRSMFLKQYYIQITHEDSLFSIKKMRFFEYDKFDWKNKIIAQYIDIAESTKETADYTAIVTVAKDVYKHEFYVLDAIAIRQNPTQYMKLILEKYYFWKPSQIGIESNNFGNLFITMLREYSQKQHVYLPITAVWHGKKDNKDNRIRSLQPLLENGTIKFRSDWKTAYGKYPEPNLIDFLIKYDGQKEHDDLPDALEGGFSLLKNQKIQYDIETI